MTTTARARAFLAACPGAVEHAGRDNRTFEVACAAVERFDLPEAELAALLLAWNREANTPPLPDATVRVKLASARRTTTFDPDKATGTAPRGPRASQERRQPPPPAPEPPPAPLPTEEDLAAARDRLINSSNSAAATGREYLDGYGIDPVACGWGLAHLPREEAATFALPAAAAGWRFLVPVYLPDGTLADVRRYRGPFGNGSETTKVLPWAKGHGTAKPYGWWPLPDAEELVWCEGEKDREALAAAGFAAVSHTCGASSARKVAEALPADLVTGRRFVLLFDRDEAGAKAAAKLAETLAGRGAAVSVATWPDTLPDGRPTPPGFDAADWFAAGLTAPQLGDLLAAAAPVSPIGETAPASANLPEIVVTGEFFDAKIDQARAAVTAANQPPDLFIRSGELVEVRGDEHGWPIIAPVTPASLRARMARSAQWFKLVKLAGSDGGGWAKSPTDPPKDVVESALAEKTGDRWRLPALVAVVQVPTLRPDGTILRDPGYDPATRLFYTPPAGLDVPTIPDAPTQAEARAALARVWDLFAQFPFVDPQADRAGALALLLTPVIRPAINGHVPLALINAPQQGTGKSLLAEVVSMIATGSATFASAPKRGDDAEWRKCLTTYLAAGNTIIGFDNVDDVLRSAELARALTTAVWQDRVLGRSEQLRVPVKATWIATGNNLRVGGDLARRCYRVTLDARTAEPWERQGFRYPDLKGHVTANRGQILADLLTVARSWYAAGQPEAAGLPQLGSFEEWRRIVGGILHFAGETGFLANLRELYEEADPDAASWRAFFEAWHGYYGETPVTVKQIADTCDGARGGQKSLVSDEDQLREAMAEAVPAFLFTDDGQINRRSLGKQLDKLQGRRYPPDNIRVERAGQDAHTKNLRYVVKRDDPVTPEPNTATQSRSQSGSAVFAVFGQDKAREPNSETLPTLSCTGGANQTPQTPQTTNEAASQADLGCGVSSANTASDPDPDEEGTPW